MEHPRIHEDERMIRFVRQWLACRRLNKLVAKQRKLNSGYAKRRQAMLKFTRGLSA